MTAGRPRLCSDADLGYTREAWRPEPGCGLSFDESYRLAHLPLIAPGHPLSIVAVPGRPYRMGRHPPTRSLALPIDAASLRASPSFDELLRAVSSASFASRICWPLLERRWDRLHATLAGALTEADVARLDRAPSLADLGPVAVELRGLFAGRINRGRLYLRAYPEIRGGRHAFAAVHDLLGRRAPDLVLVGLFNLLEELEPSEAEDLGRLLEAWWHRPILATTATRLVVLSAVDDLVLDSEVVDALSIAG